MILQNLRLGGPVLPMEYQTENAECGLACIAMIASYHGYITDLAKMRSKFKISLKGVNGKYLQKVANKLNLDCSPQRYEMGSLHEAPLPAIMHWDMHHFVVLKKVAKKGVTVHDPRLGVKDYTWAELSPHFSGPILELRPNLQFQPKNDRQTIDLRRVLGRVTGLKRSLTQAAIFAAALEVFSVLAPMTTQLIVDDALVSSDKDLLWLVLGGAVFLGFMRAACSYYQSKVLLNLSTSMGTQWVANVVAYLLKLKDEYFQKRHLGDTLSRMGSIASIQQTLTVGFLGALLDGAMTIVTLTMLFIYSPKLAGIAIVAVIVYAALRLVRYERLRSASEGQLQKQALQQTKFMEIVRGIQTIKMFNAQEATKNRYMKLVVDSTNSSIAIQQLNIQFQAVNTSIVVIEGALILGIGAHDYLTGSGMTVGMLMAILAYKDQFTSRVTSLVDRLIEFRMLRLQIDRLADIVLSPPEEDLQAMGMEQKVEPSIELIDVGFRYGDSEKWIVRHVNLRVEAGESVVLVGPSGCGKTTLLNLMLHSLTPTEGQILIGGKPISQVGLSHWRNMVGAVMQEDRLFSGSIASNIAFWPQETTIDFQRVEDCAREVHLHDTIAEMPYGYETMINDANAALSGGEKQRLLLARALYKQPQILFLDEATSHLDANLDARITQNIARLNATRVIIAHRPETIRASGRVILVNHEQWLAGGVAVTAATAPQLKEVKVMS